MRMGQRAAQLFAGVACVAMPSIGHAQAAPQPAGSGVNKMTIGQAGTQDLADIIVTGSRVITNGNASPTPLTVVSTESLLKTTPSTVFDGLNKLPVFSPNSSLQTAGSGGGTPGNFLNLRGFGANRTLILLDGHRASPSNASGLVDVNTLPEMFVKRVDVVTGGASAVYGSDAITGVVNFVLDHDFQGVRGEAQAGISSRGDNGSRKLGLAAGHSFADGRGHIEASFQHYESDGIAKQSARRNGALSYGELGAGTAANPFRLVPNARATYFSPNGLIVSGPLADREFASNGVLTPFVHGAQTGSFGIEQGGSGGTLLNTPLVAGLNRDQAFGRLDYDFGAVSAFVQGSYVSSKVSHNLTQPAVFFQLISANNAFLSPQVRAAANAGGVPVFAFTRFLNNSPTSSAEVNTSNASGAAGLRGDIGPFRWDLAYSYASIKQKTTTEGVTNYGRMAAALDAVSSNGQIVCNVTITNPGLYPGCIPLNPFGPSAENPAAVAYVRGTTHSSTTSKFQDLSFNIAGPLFDLPAGPVQVALSGEYRKQKISGSSDSRPTDFLSCVGLRFNCTPGATNVWSTTVAPISGRQNNVGEAAFEAQVPLLKDLPFVQSLSLNGAFRYAHYSVSGNAKTWKVGLDWHPVEDLRLRATRSRDFRAPTLIDLFGPASARLTGFTDVHTGSAGVVTVQSQGNPNLKPEISNTKTVGIVYQPSWLPRFSVSVDYFDISIDNAIAEVGGNDPSVLEQCDASGGTSPLCSLYVRPLPFSNRTPANFPLVILTQPLNVARTSTRGVDAELNYGFTVGDGQVNLRLLTTYQPRLRSQTIPGAVVSEAAGAAATIGSGVPKWKVAANLNYSTGGFSVDIFERWRSSLRQSSNPNLVFVNGNVSAVAYTDLTLSYEVGDDHAFGFFLSAQNLFDKQPPVFISPGFASSPGFSFPNVVGDDVVGRYFTAGVRVRF